MPWTMVYFTSLPTPNPRAYPDPHPRLEHRQLLHRGHGTRKIEMPRCDGLEAGNRLIVMIGVRVVIRVQIRVTIEGSQ